MITQPQLKELYDLNDDGELVGKVIGSKRYRQVAGCKSTSGQNRIMIEGESYTLSRLITLYKTGILPPKRAQISSRQRGAAEMRKLNMPEINSLLARKWI